MSLIRIDHNPPRRQLLVFGAAWLVFFAVLGALSAWRGSTTAMTALWILAVAVPLVGWFSPGFMRIAYLAMAYLAFPIGFVVSHVLLAGIYYLVITPTGLLMRLLGHDPMNRRFDRAAKSYWIERTPSENVERYFRQF